jgi:pSer/pThr/pTyr-binding forkhead associated (FHA) protein
MPKLIVENQDLGDSVFALEQGEFLIGRGDDVQLLLPNVSVSRNHARITVAGDEVTVEDLDSRNGTGVNNILVTKQVLSSGDELRLGKFVLIFLGDERSDQFYRGRFVGYLREYSPRQSFTEDSTFAMSPVELRRMQAQQSLIRDARLVLSSNPAQFWHPEARTLTLGGDAMIPVEGMFTSGVIAELKWDGKAHRLIKIGRMVAVSINEQSITDQILRRGDRIKIGNTRFRYEMPED